MFQNWNLDSFRNLLHPHSVPSLLMQLCPQSCTRQKFKVIFNIFLSYLLSKLLSSLIQEILLTQCSKHPEYEQFSSSSLMDWIPILFHLDYWNRLLTNFSAFIFPTHPHLYLHTILYTQRDYSQPMGWGKKQKLKQWNLSRIYLSNPGKRQWVLLPLSPSVCFSHNDFIAIFE